MTTGPHWPQPPDVDDQRIWQILMSSYASPTLCVAVELGLFRALAETPDTVDGIAARLELGPRAAEAMLGVLCSLGLLRQSGGVLHLDHVARTFLVPESPYFWGGMLSVHAPPVSAAGLLEAVRREKAKSGSAEAIWERNEMSPEMAEAFTAAMHSHSFPAAMGLARAGGLEGVSHLLDVGGGSACYPIALAQRYPGMAFTVLELPAVCPIARRYVERFGLADRIDTLAADMFDDAWPEGCDGIFFSNVWHAWGLARCGRLARRSFEALPSGGRIFLHEMLLNDSKDSPAPVVSFSLTMLLFTEGKQYTYDELRTILCETGFEDVRAHPTFGYYSLVSARKP